MVFKQNNLPVAVGAVDPPNGGYNEFHQRHGIEDIDFEEENPPDGGYGWVCVGACFVLNGFTWGTVSVSHRAGSPNRGV